MIFILILCTFKASEAAIALGKAEEHPDFPGQCYDPSTNVIKTVGEKWPLKNGCGRVMCEKWGTALYFSYSTCPSVGAASPCNIVSGDPKASYPSCCPRVECPQEAENEISTREDQLMMASSNPRRIATYDVTLDTEDDQEAYNDQDDQGFSNVFPLWRDIRRDTNVGIDDEEKPLLFKPKK